MVQKKRIRRGFARHPGRWKRFFKWNILSFKYIANFSFLLDRSVLVANHHHHQSANREVCRAYPKITEIFLLQVPVPITAPKRVVSL